jgi:aryl-alcohol dehydrogenase-like predicted oxidoreductase
MEPGDVRLHQSFRGLAVLEVVGRAAATATTVPRFTDAQARKANLAFVELLQRIAAQKDATPAHVALAWLLTQKPWIVPIPGTTKLHRLEENLAAVNVELTADDLREIDDAQIRARGERYQPAQQRMIDR